MNRNIVAYGLIFVGLLAACTPPQPAEVTVEVPVEVTREVEVTRIVEVTPQAAARPTPAAAETGDDVVASVPASGETDPAPNNGATSPAIWLHPTDLEESTIIGTDDNGGLGVYDLEGKQLQYLAEGEFKNLDIRYNFPLAGEPATLLAATVDGAADIRLFTVLTSTREISSVGTLPTGIPATGLCLYYSPVSGGYYAFVNSEEGDVEQWQLLADANGVITGTLARAFSVGSETEGCVADDELSRLYISEEEVGIWQYGAEPEEGTTRRLVDHIGQGRITEQVEGLTLYYGDDGTGYLIGSDESGSRFLVYDRSGENDYISAFTVGERGDVDEVSETNGIDAVNLPLNDDYPAGLFVAMDDDNGDGQTNFKLVSWEAIAGAMEAPLISDSAFDLRQVGAGGAEGQGVQVPATLETAPVPSGSDAADDVAIWIHPTNPEQSTLIGTDKQGGLVVYNLQGEELQYLEIGRVNNVDLRYNFPLGDEQVALVVASNRTDNTLALYKVIPDTGELEDVATRPIDAEVDEAYGVCMYYSARAKRYYAIVNSTRNGEVAQFELFDTGDGEVDAALVRTFTVGTQTEGCVVDDERGLLYIGEEGVGIWRYGADPDSGDERVQVDVTGPDGNLTADVEGLTIYYGQGETGYLIASSQGNSRFVVYDRTGDNPYITTFQIVANDEAEIDGVSGTDGIDVTNFPLGEAFPAGVFVAQDNRNIDPDETQNFKLVSWQAIAEATDPPLLVDTTWDPRTVGAGE